MKYFLNITYHSLKNYGPKMVLTRIFKYSIVKFKRFISKTDQENLEKWKNGVDASISFANHQINTYSKRELVSQKGDPNHFDPGYFGKGGIYHCQPMNEIIEKLKMAKGF